jgi:hypothetical protein
MQNFTKKLNFVRLKIMCLVASYKKNYEKKNLFASLKSLKKGVASISQRCGSVDLNSHPSVTDPQHPIFLGTA